MHNRRFVTKLRLSDLKTLSLADFTEDLYQYFLLTTSIIEYTIKLQILDDRGYERRQDPHIKEGWHGERKISHADRADVLRPSLPG